MINNNYERTKKIFYFLLGILLVYTCMMFSSCVVFNEGTTGTVSGIQDAALTVGALCICAIVGCLIFNCPGPIIPCAVILVLCA